MTTRKYVKVSNNLRRKGFVREETHHTYYTLYVDGKMTNIVTFMSHGHKEINGRLIGEMADQLLISRKQFLEFVDCSMTYEEYVQLLRRENKLIIRNS